MDAHVEMAKVRAANNVAAAIQHLGDSIVRAMQILVAAKEKEGK